VFLKVFRALGQWRGDSAFSTWLYRLTANHCLDVLRRRKVVRFISLDSEDSEGRKFEPADPSDRTGRMGKGLNPFLAGSLEVLPPPQRACLLMREMEDLSYEEIAAALDMNLGTVKSNIHRAKAALRTRLEKAGYTPDDYQ
jgi:RNA polymerase sigma-70 factor (ECF subfamily)